MKRLGHLLLLLGLVAWVVGGLATKVHETETRHVLCEHGDVVELGAEGAADAVDTLRSQDLGAEHEHGCLLDGLLSAPTLERHALVSELPDLHATPTLRGADLVLLADPLRDAPKTSPPVRI